MRVVMAILMSGGSPYDAKMPSAIAPSRQAMPSQLSGIRELDSLGIAASYATSEKTTT
jgi:hypothetical protein